jgi:hypothetical protein
MNTAADKRQALREKLAALSDADLAQRLYLISLIGRLDAELLAMRILFGPDDPDEPLRFSPKPDARLTALQHLFQQELVRRQGLKPLPIIHIEGEEHANNNGTH